MRVIKFENHLDCPYIKPNASWGGAAMCGKTQKIIDRLEPIPEWCPLPKASQQGVEADKKEPCEQCRHYQFNSNYCPSCGRKYTA